MALTEEQRLLRTVSERSWQAQVEQMLALYGFELIYHTHDSRRSRAGFPDLVAIRERAYAWDLLVVELKSEIGVTSDEQNRWLRAFHTIAALVNRHYCAVRLIVDVWRPSDTEEITRLLQEEGR